MISFANDDILFLIKILVKSHFMLMKWVFLVQILIKLSEYNFDYDDNNFYDDDPDATIYVRFLAQGNEFEKCKVLNKKINEELMPVVKYLKDGEIGAYLLIKKRSRANFY